MKVPMDYTIKVLWDLENKIFEAMCIEIPACHVCAKTHEKAVDKAYQAIDNHLAYRRKRGLNDPELLPREYSGEMLLRIPKSLHKSLAEKAISENVSLNHYVSYILFKSNVVENESCYNKPKDQLYRLHDSEFVSISEIRDEITGDKNKFYNKKCFFVTNDGIFQGIFNGITGHVNNEWKVIYVSSRGDAVCRSIPDTTIFIRYR